MLSRRWAAAALAATLLLGACGGDAGPQRSVLLVSGKDDHGFPALATVELLREPEGVAVTGVADGTLVAVRSTRGEWTEVVSLDGEQERGWVNDFYLRGTVHVVGDDPACPVPLVGEPGALPFAELRASEQVELLDVHEVDGEAWVGVRPLQRPEVGLVPRRWIQELPGPGADPDLPCAAVRVSAGAQPHRH